MLRELSGAALVQLAVVLMATHGRPGLGEASPTGKGVGIKIFFCGPQTLSRDWLLTQAKADPPGS
jgi:hypothetical protein